MLSKVKVDMFWEFEFWNKLHKNVTSFMTWISQNIFPAKFSALGVVNMMLFGIKYVQVH